MTESADRIAPHLRPAAFAAVELLLGLMAIAKNLASVECETILIYLVVTEATMRPLMGVESERFEVTDLARAPEESRGSATRRYVANRLGLARESVRRKIKTLIEAGLLVDDGKGGIRSLGNLDQPAVQTCVVEAMELVELYLARLGRSGLNLTA